MTDKPLVSIGVPTCNRASMLERALKSLVSQDYPNLEIVISDNASTDDTPSICAQFQEQYPFILYHRNPVMVPAFKNFEKVLLLASGYYFMWASDDDLWESNFVSTLVDYMEKNDSLVLVAAEAQYMLHNGTKLPFFREGVPFYNPLSHSRLRRFLLICGANYGNLIYRLYRREALLTQGGGTVLDVCKFINEIPIFIQVAARGSIQVCDKVLFYKTTSLPTYLQAAREYGFTPTLDQQHLIEASKRPTLMRDPLPNRGRFGRLRKLLRPAKGLLQWCRYSSSVSLYHARTLADIRRAIWRIDTSFAIKFVLLIAFTARLTAHLLKLVIIWQVQDVIRNRVRVRH